MATILYRQLDENYEPLFGSNQTNFLQDIYAVAQAIKTRLNLWTNEWWESLLDGLPMLTNILGVMGGRGNQASLAIQQRILGTPYVVDLENVSSNFNPSSRAFSFSCEASVSFGSGTIAVVGSYNQTSGTSFTATVAGG